MKIYDLSVAVHEGMPTWPGDPPLVMKLAKSIARGDRSNVTRLEMSAHTGTHVDAPFHFQPGGSGVDRLPLEVLLGPCRVFDLTGRDAHIDRAALESCDLRGVQRALFKTRNSRLWAGAGHEFDRNFVAIVNDGAEHLVQTGVRLVGVDYLSVEPYGSKEHPVHHVLLQAGVVIVEGLNLSAVPAGDYELMVLPLKLKDADGAPARALLRTREDS